MPATYQDRLKEHLARYKTERLGVTANGLWAKNGRSYAHILPAARRFENFLAPYRDDLCRYLDAHPEVKLHRDFHHLNSSQAMCLNLFYPLAADGARRCILTRALGQSSAMAAGDSWSFEKVPDPQEGTNFDFLYVTNDVGTARAFFEIKLSEGGFGTAGHDRAHLDKLEAIYRPRLSGRVLPGLLEPDAFLSRYQLCRSFSHLQRPADTLFVVFPRANVVLSDQLENFLGFVSEEHRTSVNAVYLEDMVARILALVPEDAERLRRHYGEFAEKYVLP